MDGESGLDVVARDRGLDGRSNADLVGMRRGLEPRTRLRFAPRTRWKLAPTARRPGLPEQTALHTHIGVTVDPQNHTETRPLKLKAKQNVLLLHCMGPA